MSKRFSHAMALVLVLSLAGGAGADLIGWWTFDEGTGTVAQDYSGNGNNGTFSGTPQWVTGMLKGALQFASSAYLDCGSSTTLQVAGPITMACWVNPASLGGEQSFAARSAEYAFKASGTSLRFTTPGILDHTGANSTLTANTWQHVAATFNPGQAGGLIFYINGVETERLTASNMNAGTGPFLIANNQWSEMLTGMIDDLQVYNEILPPEVIQKIMKGLADAALASNPVPDDQTVDVPRDVILNWTAGESAATHDVYFGTDFDDVNEAPQPIQNVTDAAYDPDGLLEYGQTYYWRIDEVNGAPDYTVFKGSVWSFTAEPYSYPITNVTVQASAAQATSPAIRTIDGSGLDELDQHGVDLKTMWVTPGGLPAWIQYTFDKVYKLHELWVWNANSELEVFMGFGAKDVVIEYSTDGETWTALENVPEFAQGTSSAVYTANTIVDFGEVMAKYVKLTINDNWGATAMVSLSEVRFFYKPVQAFGPQPEAGAVGVSVETDLTWRPGREATSHVVYVGTDSNAVADGIVSGETVTEHSYTPADLLLATEYFWKVDEVGDTGTYAGDVWSFTTEEFAVVDDFESYNDDIEAETTIWHAWIDGLTDEASGSQVGYTDAPFAERTIVHSGKQSMPLQYNSTSFAFSEAKRTFDEAQDWTARSIKTLSLFFAGAAGNGGQLYVKINNTKVAYDGDAADLKRSGWQAWNIDLSKAGNVSSVRSLTIGIEGSGATGTLYIDDIRLYPKAPEFSTPAEPDSANLIARYTFNGDVKDSSGRNRNGTANGGPTYVAGVDGQAIHLDGVDDYVVVGSVGISGAAPRTISGWVKADTTTITDWTNLFGFTSSAATNALSFDMNKMGGSNTYCIHAYGWERNIMAIDLEWHHLAATYDGTTVAWYGDGQSVSSEAWILNTQDNVQMGKRGHAAGGNFPGSIDEVRIYDKALSFEEIAWLAGRRLPIHQPL